MQLEEKRAIILAARAARRNGLPASANPYAEDSPQHAEWAIFYHMALTDEFRNDLIDSEYEASAY